MKKSTLRLKPDGFDGEEIASQNLIFIVSHQLTPADGTIANRGRLDSVAVENIREYFEWSIEKFEN